MSNLFRPKFYLDYLCLFLLGAWIYFIISKVGAWLKPPDYFDGVNYMRMAQNPLAFLDPQILPHHAQRIFPSWMVGLLHQFGFSYFEAFYFYSRLLFMLWMLGSFIVLRSLGVTRLLSLSLVALLPFCYWAYRYPLTNIFQLNDLCSHAFPFLFIFAVYFKSYRFLMFMSVIAVLSRQNLVVLVAGSYLYLFYQTRDWKVLFQAIPSAVTFLLSTLLAGGGATEQLQNHTALNFNAARGAFFNSKIYLIGMPFVLWCFNIRVLGECLVRYFWISAFVIITALQPLGHYFQAGPSNFERIFAQAAWWLIFPAGMSLQALYEKNAKYFSILVLGVIIFMRLAETGQLPQEMAVFATSLNIGALGFTVSLFYAVKKYFK